MIDADDLNVERSEDDALPPLGNRTESSAREDADRILRTLLVANEERVAWG